MSGLKKPGTDNQQPGKYKEVGPRGGEVNKPRVVKIGLGTDFHQHRKKDANGKNNNN